MNSDYDRILALAGIFQAAHLVDNIAKKGLVDADDLETSIFSIFQTEAETIEDVFHDKSHLKTGLKCILEQLTQKKSHRIDVTRYVLQLMHLANKLVKTPKNLSALSEGIELAKKRSDSFSITHTNILSQLADLYSDNISNLSSRIMVNGEPLHLNNPDNIHKVRAVLLAGVRAAWLWQQCGGKRRQMIFSRKKIYQLAENLLNDISDY